MTCDDFRSHPQLVDERTEPHAQRLYAHQVDLFLKQPSRVIFTEPGGPDHGPRFISVCVGRQSGLRDREHREPRTGICWRTAHSLRGEAPQSLRGLMRAQIRPAATMPLCRLTKAAESLLQDMPAELVP